jgi:hypothetical protein
MRHCKTPNAPLLYYCSRNGKKVLLQKGEFLKRHQLNVPTQGGITLDSIQLTILIKMEPKRAPQKPLT